jgi:hypothetical protein
MFMLIPPFACAGLAKFSRDLSLNCLIFQLDAAPLLFVILEIYQSCPVVA